MLTRKVATWMLIASLVSMNPMAWGRTYCVDPAGGGRVFNEAPHERNELTLRGVLVNSEELVCLVDCGLLAQREILTGRLHLNGRVAAACQGGGEQLFTEECC